MPIGVVPASEPAAKLAPVLIIWKSEYLYTDPIGDQSYPPASVVVDLEPVVFSVPVPVKPAEYKKDRYETQKARASTGDGKLFYMNIA